MDENRPTLAVRAVRRERYARRQRLRWQHFHRGPHGERSVRRAGPRNKLPREICVDCVKREWSCSCMSPGWANESAVALRSPLVATFRLASISRFSKGQKCSLDLTAGASEQRDEDMSRCAAGLGGAWFSRMSFVAREVKVPDQFTMLAGLCARRTGLPGRRAGCSTRSCANAHGDCLQKKLWRNASIELLRAPRGPTLNPYRPRNTARRGVHLSWKCLSAANHTRSVVGPRLRRTTTV